MTNRRGSESIVAEYSRRSLSLDLASIPPLVMPARCSFHPCRTEWHNLLLFSGRTLESPECLVALHRGFVHPESLGVATRLDEPLLGFDRVLGHLCVSTKRKIRDQFGAKRAACPAEVASRAGKKDAPRTACRGYNSTRSPSTRTRAPPSQRAAPRSSCPCPCRPACAPLRAGTRSRRRGSAWPISPTTRSRSSRATPPRRARKTGCSSALVSIPSVTTREQLGRRSGAGEKRYARGWQRGNAERLVEVAVSDLLSAEAESEWQSLAAVMAVRI